MANIYKNILLIAFLLGNFSIVSQAFGNEKEYLNEYTLDQIVITATRTEKKLIDTPANALIITADEIKSGGYQSAFEAIKNLSQAGANMYQEDGGDTGGMMSRIRLRGMDNGTLLLIDGHPSNFLNATALNSIPADRIERIEIIKGASSVLYGPQAMAGVVNIITKKPLNDTKTTGTITGSIGNLYKDAGLNVTNKYFNFGVKKVFYGDLDDLTKPPKYGTSGSSGLQQTKDRSSEQLYGTVRLAKDLTVAFSRMHNLATWEQGNFTNYKKNITKEYVAEAAYNTYSMLYDNQDTGWKSGLTYAHVWLDATYKYGAKSSYYGGYNLDFDLQKNSH